MSFPMYVYDMELAWKNAQCMKLLRFILKHTLSFHKFYIKVALKEYIFHGQKLVVIRALTRYKIPITRLLSTYKPSLNITVNGRY